MSNARRGFIKSLTVTLFSAGIAFGAAKLIFGQNLPRGKQPVAPPMPINDADFRIPSEAHADRVISYTSDTFSPYVGDIFQAPSALGQIAELKLTSVNQYKVKPTTRISTRKTRQPDSFSLLFTSEERLPKFTSIHRLNHPALGEFEVFLSPRELAGGIYIYEAVFNHLN